MPEAAPYLPAGEAPQAENSNTTKTQPKDVLRDESRNPNRFTFFKLTIYFK